MPATKRKRETTTKSDSKKRPTTLGRAVAVRERYLPTRTLVRVVERSPTKPELGRALVVTEDVKKGDAVCTYSGRVLSQQECDALIAQHSNPFCPTVAYFLACGRDWVIDGHPRHSKNKRDTMGSFVNDARDIPTARVNCGFYVKWMDKTHVLVVVVASRDIAAGDELWTSYGRNWWRLDGRDPKAPCTCTNAGDK